MFILLDLQLLKSPDLNPADYQTERDAETCVSGVSSRCGRPEAALD